MVLNQHVPYLLDSVTLKKLLFCRTKQDKQAKNAKEGVVSLHELCTT